MDTAKLTMRNGTTDDLIKWNTLGNTSEKLFMELDPDTECISEQDFTKALRKAVAAEAVKSLFRRTGLKLTNFLQKSLFKLGKLLVFI